MIRKLVKDTATTPTPANKPADKLQDEKSADKKPGEPKKVADEAIDLSKEEFAKMLKDVIHEELIEAGLIKAKEDEESVAEDDSKKDKEEVTEVDDKPEGKDKDKAEAQPALPEADEAAELPSAEDIIKEKDKDDEKVDDSSSEDLSKILADPKKKEALQALLKDSAETVKKAGDGAAAKFVTRYDDFTTVKPAEQPVHTKNRYE